MKRKGWDCRVDWRRGGLGIRRLRDFDSVHYEILAYSQPNALIAKVGYPVVRHFQKRFARDSMNVMAKKVGWVEAGLTY